MTCHFILSQCELNEVFVSYVFNLLMRYIERAIVADRLRSTSINMPSEAILSICVPPIDRADKPTSLRFLDNETAKLDTLTAEAQRAIDLLQERRTALISAAVTGQIDVRGVCA